MATVRKIVKIDEEKCDGCGLCADACAEGAIRIIDGKASLVNESHCDGLGACIKDRNCSWYRIACPSLTADFHRDFLSGRSVLVACPKLDDAQAHLDKLTQILRRSTISSITVAQMDVPCCSGLTAIAKQAIKLSNKDIPLKEVIIGIKGDLKRAKDTS